MPPPQMTPYAAKAYATAQQRIAECRKSGTTDLSLSGLGLTDLPPEIGQLSALRWLFLQGNQLTTLPPEIGQLSALTYLYLDRNQLTTLPPEIGQLSALNTLSVSQNRLTTLPPEICQLSGLRGLDLEANQFTSLGIVVLNLANQLKQIRVWGNPLPQELLKLSGGQSGAGQKLLKYLRGARPWEKTEIDVRSVKMDDCFNEAKLLIVGKGQVGKTWLLQALQGKLPADGPWTQGLEIAREPLPLPHSTDKGRVLQLTCWDFGGQDHYQVTNQIFFTPKSLYLLVWKPRTGPDPDLFHKLNRIKESAGSTAKVFLVSTHAASGPAAVIGQEEILEKYGNLIGGFHAVDSAAGPDGVGIAALKEALAQAAAQLEGMDLPIPDRFIECQKALRKLPEPMLTYAEFQTLAAKHGLDAEDASILVGLMEVQGHVIFFANAPDEADAGVLEDENPVVLNPEWLAKAVSLVMDDDATRLASGVLKHASLKKIWKKDQKRQCPGYHQNLHGYLLWLMWRVDIAYRQDSDTSLIPEMVHRNRPDHLLWNLGDPVATGHREAALICEIQQDPPEGILPALTAAVHPWRKPGTTTADHLDRNWRDGFFLDTAHGTAYVEKRDRLVWIVTRGQYPAYLAEELRSRLETVVGERARNMVHRFCVPCPGGLNTEKRCQGIFALDFLDARKGKEVPCQICNRDFSVTSLLEGLNPQEEEINEKLRMLAQGQREMYAGLQELYESQQALASGAYQQFQRLLDPERGERLRGPNLFTILPAEGSAWNLLSRLTETKIRITCWCEHPGGPHPLHPIGSGKGPEYILSQPMAWLKTISPYMSWATLALRAFIPGAAVALKDLMGADLTLELKVQIDTMQEGGKALPTGKLELEDAKLGRMSMHRHSPELDALTRIHDALLNDKQVKPATRWGGLRPVETKAGQLLWLCETHANEQSPPPQNLG